MSSLLPSGLVLPNEAWRDAWEGALGSYWRFYLFLLAALAFVTGAALPLFDPDLGMHLATGEWIARHRTVPLVEPFAWTRAGAPYYAYSWALELLYYKLLETAGATALQVLQGIQFVLVAAVIFPLGRSLGWTPWTVLVVALGNMLVALTVAAYLRPQLTLLYIVPLAWAVVYRAREAPNAWPSALGLLLLGAASSNTHLMFPLVGVPCVLLLTERPRRPPALVVLPLSIVVGWVLNPYALHLTDILRLNLGDNLFLRPPSIVSEFSPGFQLATQDFGMPTFIVALLILVPWLIANRMSSVERVLHGALWLAGLVTFALYVRGLSLWWLVSLPIVGAACQLLPAPSSPIVRLAQVVAFASLGSLIAGYSLDAFTDPWTKAGGVESRFLPGSTGTTLEPLAKWIECKTRKGAKGRLTTIFLYGSYGAWRLPQFSESIDGRTIFPDSAGASEVFLRPPITSIPVAPWRDADLAILPSRNALAPMLDSASGWRRVANVATVDGPVSSVGLWVKESWWRDNGITALPRSAEPAYLRDPLESRRCSDLKQ